MFETAPCHQFNELEREVNTSECPQEHLLSKKHHDCSFGARGSAQTATSTSLPRILGTKTAYWKPMFETVALSSV